MSRSIHDTHGVALRAWVNAFRTGSDLELQRANRAKQNIAQQRKVKQRLREQRVQADAPPLDVDSVPISISDEAPHVHHAASETDVREVMRRLPRGSIDGRLGIELCLGGDDRDAPSRRRGELAERDPYTGFPGDEILPGIYSGYMRGWYRRIEGVLRIHAFVCASEPPPFLALYLRLRALATLVHELAHHFDFRFRTRGDRWRNDDYDKSESYARTVALEQVTRCVVPYLEAQYPDACAALSEWIKGHAGVALPLAVLTDDRTHNAWMVDVAFRKLVSEVEGGEPDEGRISLAIALHLARHNDYCEPVVAALLACDPEERSALLVRANIDARRGRFVPAEAILRQLLTRNRQDMGAWRSLMRVLQAQSRWQELADVATEAIDQLEPGGKAQLAALQHRARASVMLARWERLNEDLEHLKRRGTISATRSTEVFATWKLCRTGAYREALTDANRLLKLGGVGDELKAELLAVRLECAQQLGDSRRAWRLAPADVDQLRERGHGDWVQSLASQG